MWVLLRPPQLEEPSMQTITTIGLDIAKSVFQVHGVDAEGKVIIRRQLKRRYVLAFFQKLPPCLVGIEACASSHHWSRELKALGHTVRLMPPAYVKPYVKRQKNDAADAEAICEAVTRTNMRFVATAYLFKPAGYLRRNCLAIFDPSARSVDRNKRVSMAMDGGKSRISSRSARDRQRLKIGRCLAIGKVICWRGRRTATSQPWSNVIRVM